tara:strand:+ start:368 stop:544 length:177 start_codon:yes stop_codon:yes gene_type:complete
MEHYSMVLTLKEKIAKSRLRDQLKQERQIYLDAIQGGSKFSEFYTTKADELTEQLAVI